VQTTFDVNVFGTISLTKLVAPHMLKQGGGHFVVVRGDYWGIVFVNFVELYLRIELHIIVYICG